jgi:N-acetylmuramoyl-L-alanine amidase
MNFLFSLFFSFFFFHTAVCSFVPSSEFSASPSFFTEDSSDVDSSFTTTFPSSGFPIVNSPQNWSPNYTPSSSRTINSIILHYTAGSLDGSIDWFRDPSSHVSAHYVIARNGTIFVIVDEKNIAWHAGISFWRGSDGLNSLSVGIEIVNPGVEDATRIPLQEALYPHIQAQAVFWLVNQIQSRYRIPFQRIAGHSDIAPDRKADPGELFPWTALMSQYANPPMINCTEQQNQLILAKYGQGNPKQPNSNVEMIQNNLFSAGYGIANNSSYTKFQPRGSFGVFDDDMALTVVAFRRRFNQPPLAAYGSGWSKLNAQVWTECDDLILNNVLNLFPAWLHY